MNALYLVNRGIQITSSQTQIKKQRMQLSDVFLKNKKKYVTRIFHFKTLTLRAGFTKVTKENV